MCARYEVDADLIEVQIGPIRVPIKVRRRGTIFPKYHAPVVRAATADPGTTLYESIEGSWGWPVPGKPRPYSNTRSETAHKLGLWKTALRTRRCLIPGTAWIEFKEIPGAERKQPWRMRDGETSPFFFAGLWRPATTTGPGVPSIEYSMLTRDPADELADIHNRMPLVLPPDAYAHWLDPGLTDVATLLASARTTAWHREVVTTFLPAAKPEPASQKLDMAEDGP